MDEEFYDDYEDYEVIGKKKLNQKGGRKSKGSFIQQEEAGKKGSSKAIKQWVWCKYYLNLPKIAQKIWFSK